MPCARQAPKKDACHPMHGSRQGPHEGEAAAPEEVCDVEKGLRSVVTRNTEAKDVYSVPVQQIAHILDALAQRNSCKVPLAAIQVVFNAIF